MFTFFKRLRSLVLSDQSMLCRPKKKSSLRSHRGLARGGFLCDQKPQRGFPSRNMGSSMKMVTFFRAHVFTVTRYDIKRKSPDLLWLPTVQTSIVLLMRTLFSSAWRPMQASFMTSSCDILRACSFPVGRLHSSRLNWLTDDLQTQDEM